MQRLRALVFCTVLASGFVVSGCAQLAPLLPKIASVILDAMGTLQLIDKAASEFFDSHPKIPQDIKDEYRVAFSKTVLALNAANHALAGAEDVDQKAYDDAFAQFKQAYLNLVQVISSQGIASAQRVTLGGKSVYLPEPEAFRVEVVR